MKQLFFRLYLLLILTLVGLGWSIDKLYNTVSTEEQLTSDVELHKGTFFLLDTELRRHPEHERPSHLEALATSFGYQVQLVEINSLEVIEQASEVAFSSQQLEYLSAGGIVPLFNDIAGESWFFKRLTNTDQIMVLGPIYGEPFVQSDVVYALILFIALAFIVFIWVWPISKGLMSMTRAATAFGKGDFSARASTQVPSPMLNLVERFNSMASRIQRLIKSHKELSHAVSHELRTPIARIRFAMEIIRDEDDKALIHQYIDTMDQNIEELDALVDELLIYARFDREEPQLNITKVNLAELIEEVTERFVVTEPDLHFHVHVDSEGSEKLNDCQIDKDAISRVVDNLLRNAVRYANKHIDVDVSVIGKDVVVAVNDDGPGIPKSQWQALFEPFVRLDQSRDRKSGGIGLGLAIVKRFIELHQGSVKIGQSKKGGASFILAWPHHLSLKTNKVISEKS
ncbi:ATP-binding protein [Thalassotalea euphylliae]|uniref:ATP-binding protein n=1 Tax=Thalassotalea euphylliae TaxID=1655234 RepID=UPI00362B1063